LEDPNLKHIIELLGTDRVKEFRRGEDKILRIIDKICIPADEELKRIILEEGHKSHLNLHLGITKMYKDLKESFWWSGMKKEIP